MPLFEYAYIWNGDKISESCAIAIFNYPVQDHPLFTPSYNFFVMLMLHHSWLQLISGLGITTPLAYLRQAATI